ncbi:hypothetical protein ACLB2K_022347 [Fragaria x ananassa]
MNPSNAGSDFSFSSSSRSGLSRPRLLKVRRGLNSQVLEPSPSPEAGAPSGFNPFRSSGSGDDSDSNLNKGRGVTEQMSDLRIGSGVETKDDSGSRLSSAGGFVFGGSSSSFDESVASDMSKLNIEGSGSGGAVERGNDGRFDSRTGFGVGSKDNVGGSLGRNADSELLHELEKKLNINENEQMGGAHNADGVNKFVFSTSKSFGGSSVNALPDQMKNLNVGLSFDGGKREYSVEKDGEFGYRSQGWTLYSIR